MLVTCLVLLASAAQDSSGDYYFSPTLLDLCDNAAHIVIGRVESVTEVTFSGRMTAEDAKEDPLLAAASAMPVAELAVERVLKGDPETKHLRFLAAATRAGDVSSAVPGERVLMFLSDWEVLDRRILGYRSPAQLPDAQRVHYVTWDGRGRMPLRGGSNGRDVLEVGDTHVPTFHCGKAGPGSTADAAAVLEFVVQAVPFPPEALAVHQWAFRGTYEDGPPGDESFEWRVLPDGRFRLSRGVHERERTSFGWMEPERISELEARFQVEGFQLWTRPEQLPRGTANCGLNIKLAGRRQGTSFRRADPAGHPDPLVADDIRRSMATWSIVRDLLDCPECLSSTTGTETGR